MDRNEKVSCLFLIEACRFLEGLFCERLIVSVAQSMEVVEVCYLIGWFDLLDSISDVGSAGRCYHQYVPLT